jgi:hypothetical protein
VREVQYVKSPAISARTIHPEFEMDRDDSGFSSAAPKAGARMFRRILSVMFVPLAATLAMAQDAAPASAPTSAPTTQVVAMNQDTPRGTLKLLTKAMDEGDTETIAAVLLPASPAEKTFSEHIADLAAATGKLKKAAVATFGEEGAKSINDPAAANAAMGHIDASTEEVNGDSATVRDGSGPVMALKRVDGKWRVPMSELLRLMDADTPGKLSEKSDILAITAAAINETAAETTKGKYKTAKEAIQAARGKMVKAAMERQRSATQPATTRAVENQ